MGDISEREFAAGWMSNLEYLLWARIVGDSEHPRLDQDQLHKLSWLSGAIDGWIAWVDDVETHIPLYNWLVMYQQWKEKNNARAKQ